MAERVTPPVAGARYHHLDALRGCFMLIGVFVHVATLGDDPIFDGIVRASGLFRMEGFFVISGFLSAVLTGRYGDGAAVRRRLAAVGVPLLFTGVLLNPPTLWMLDVFHSGHDISFAGYLEAGVVPALTGELNWYLHLWFLLVLLGYAPLTPPAVRLLTRLASADAYRWATADRPRAMATITLFVLVTVTAAQVVWTVAAAPLLGRGFHADLVRRSLEFLPFFLLGLLLHLDRGRLVPFFQRPAPVLLALAGLVLLASWRDWIGVLSAGTGRALAEALFAIPLLATMFAVASRFASRPRPALRRLADASYTVYLSHFFWIYAFAMVLGLDPGLGSPQMLLLVSATYGATFALHYLVIRRSPLLQKIVNGRFRTRARTAADPPGPRDRPAAAAVHGGRHAGRQHEMP